MTENISGSGRGVGRGRVGRGSVGRGGVGGIGMSTSRMAHTGVVEIVYIIYSIAISTYRSGISSINIVSEIVCVRIYVIGVIGARGWRTKPVDGFALVVGTKIGD